MSNSKGSKKAAHVRKRRQKHDVADWGGINAELLVEVIATVTKDGGAIRLGYSRDGGAYSVGIYGDGEPFTEYLGATEDLDAWFEGLKLDYE